ncbi:hypothetical protein BGZ76_011268 [Entomortierella beljakovae]|nr:hypothetical protein BGZ76_011268 [Entomortierella beljakovae]
MACPTCRPTKKIKKQNSGDQIGSTSKRTRGDDEIDTDDEVGHGKRGDIEVSDDEVSGDEVGADDETTVLYEENLRQEVIRELGEVEENTEPGFYPLICALYHVAGGKKFQRPNAKPTLSAPQSFLWVFVYSRLNAFGTMTPSEQKDVFVAISGIVDLELYESFPGRHELIEKCRAQFNFTYPAIRDQIKVYQEFVDIQDGMEEARLDNLRQQLRTDMARFKEGSTQMMVAEILMILMKRCVPDKFGRAKRTELSSLFVWYAVWEVLFTSTAVEVEVGETILREAQKDQVAVRVVVGSKAAVGRAGASGRKLDYRLVATVKTGQRFVPFTLSNDEHKGLGSTTTTVAEAKHLVFYNDIR